MATLVTSGTITTTSATRQLSDANPAGTVLGQSSTDLISFFGATPVVQPAGPSQAAVARGSASGVVITNLGASTSVAFTGSLTTTEKTIVQQVAAGSNFVLGTADICYVNKPTTDAGLAVGNVRVTTAGTIGVTYTNFTTTSITPTVSQSYAVVALRGFTNTTATLTPAAVAPSTVTEQLFPVSGVRANELIQVTKPTHQAGLNILGCRVASNGTIGISFCNITAATITPTAAEVYLVASLGGIDAVNNDVLVQTLQSPATLSASTSAEQTLTVTGLLATDTVVGISKPTAQAGLVTSGSGRVTAANALGLVFGNCTASALTPTASETYTVVLKRWAPVAPLVVQSVSLTPTSVAANTSAEQTFAVTGVVAASPVWINKPSATAGIGIGGVRISSAGTIAVNYCNLTAAAITPPAETYVVGNFQLPYGDASSTWVQTASIVSQQQSQLTNAMRTAAVALGLVAGA